MMTAEFKENNTIGWYADCDPETVDDYIIVWSDWLEANALDVITNSIWITPPGVTVVDAAFTGGDTTIWLGPCAIGEHRITNRVTTFGTGGHPRMKDQSFTLRVFEM